MAGILGTSPIASLNAQKGATAQRNGAPGGSPATTYVKKVTDPSVGWRREAAASMGAQVGPQIERREVTISPVNQDPRLRAGGLDRQPMEINRDAQSDSMIQRAREAMQARASGENLEETQRYQDAIADYRGGLQSYLATQRLSGGYDPSQSRGVQFNMGRDPLAADSEVRAQQEQQIAQAELADFEANVRDAEQTYADVAADYEAFVNEYNQTSEGFQRYYIDELGYTEDAARRQALIDLQRYDLTSQMQAKERNLQAAEERRASAFNDFMTGLSIFSSVAGAVGAVAKGA